MHVLSVVVATALSFSPLHQDGTPPGTPSDTSNVDTRGQADTTDFRPQNSPTLEIRRAPGVIRLDGRLDDAGWSGAARASGFTEFQPDVDVPPPAETEVLVTYDDENLYLAFIAHGDASEIRAALTDRDEMYSDDWVGVVLDPFDDAAWGYMLVANPLGVQGDIRRVGESEDSGFDIIFHTEAAISSGRYVVEMAVPFSSLRFPDRDVQRWGLNFLRNFPRSSRHLSTWAALSRENPCLLCQNGDLAGLRDVDAGGGLELLPALVVTQAGALRTGADAPEPSSFDNESVSSDVALTARYPLSSGWTAEATFNPDYSQLSSDPSQIDVNTTFALFLPERRPFFQEGGDLFDTPIDAIHTRSIDRPRVAAKLTGRSGGSAASYIGAIDREAPVLIPLEERTEVAPVGRSVSNIVRARHTLAEETYIGGVLTDRRIDGGASGSTVGVDGRVRLHPSLRLQWQLLASRTVEPDDAASAESFGDETFAEGRHTVAFDGESFWGRSGFAELVRSGRSWGADVGYREASPTFRAANGFETRNSYRRASAGARWYFYPERAGIDRFTPGLRAGREWNFNGVRKEDYISPSLNMTLAAQTNVSASYTVERELFRGVEFDGFRNWSIGFNSAPSELIRFGGNLNGGETIARTLSTPLLGDGLSAHVWAEFQPLRRLSLEPSISYSRLRHPDEGELFAGYVARTRGSFQFTREFFLRVVGEYDDFRGSFAVEPLLLYRLNPFSVLYLGSSHDYLDTGEPGFRQSERQFFLKVQYLFRP